MFLYILNEVLLKPIVSCDIMHSYFNDVLAMPVLLAITNILGGILRYPRIAEHLPVICTVTFFASFYWEFISPLYLNKTQDMRDLFAYSAGSVLFFVIIKLRNIRAESQRRTKRNKRSENEGR
jgi:hypothetical protein